MGLPSKDIDEETAGKIEVYSRQARQAFEHEGAMPAAYGLDHVDPQVREQCMLPGAMERAFYSSLYNF